MSLSHCQAEGPLLIKGGRYGGVSKGWSQCQGTPGDGHIAHQLMRRAAEGSSCLRGGPTTVLNPLHRALARVLHFYRTQPCYPPNSMKDRFTPEGREEERKPSPAGKVQLPPDFHLLKSSRACKPHLTACRVAELEEFRAEQPAGAQDASYPWPNSPEPHVTH